MKSVMIAALLLLGIQAHAASSICILTISEIYGGESQLSCDGKINKTFVIHADGGTDVAVTKEIKKLLDGGYNVVAAQKYSYILTK